MNRRILRLAIPNIISNITVPLLGMVDMALMGHLDNKAYIGAIALGSMIFNFIYWGFGFLRMSTSGFVAQVYGRRDLADVMLNLARPYLLWPVVVPIVSFSAFLWDGIFIGATASAAMRNSMLISTLVIYFPAYYLLLPVLDNHALWLALILLLAARGVTLTLMARRYVLKNFGQI